MPGPHRRVLRVLPRGAPHPAPASGVRKPQRGPHAVRGGVSQRPQPTKPPDGARPPGPSGEGARPGIPGLGAGGRAAAGRQLDEGPRAEGGQPRGRQCRLLGPDTQPAIVRRLPAAGPGRKGSGGAGRRRGARRGQRRAGQGSRLPPGRPGPPGLASCARARGRRGARGRVRLHGAPARPAPLAAGPARGRRRGHLPSLALLGGEAVPGAQGRSQVGAAAWDAAGRVQGAGGAAGARLSGRLPHRPLWGGPQRGPRLRPFVPGTSTPALLKFGPCAPAVSSRRPCGLIPFLSSRSG